jgi:hypothetical protein
MRLAVAMLAAPFIDLETDLQSIPELSVARRLGNTSYTLTGELATACSAEPDGRHSTLLVDGGAGGSVPNVGVGWVGPVSTYGVRPSELLVSCVGDVSQRVPFRLAPPTPPRRLLGDDETSGFMAECAEGTDHRLLLLSSITPPPGPRDLTVRPAEILAAATNVAEMFGAISRQCRHFVGVLIVRSTIQRPDHAPDSRVLVFGDPDAPARKAGKLQTDGSVAALLGRLLHATPPNTNPPNTNPPNTNPPNTNPPLCLHAGDEYRLHVAASPLVRACRLWVPTEPPTAVEFSQLELNVLFGADSPHWHPQRDAASVLRALSIAPLDPAAILRSQRWFVQVGGESRAAHPTLLPAAYRVNHRPLEQNNEVCGMNAKLHADIRLARRAIEAVRAADPADAANAANPVAPPTPVDPGWFAKLPRLGGYGGLGWMSRLVGAHSRPVPKGEPVAASQPVELAKVRRPRPVDKAVAQAPTRVRKPTPAPAPTPAAPPPAPWSVPARVLPPPIPTGKVPRRPCAPYAPTRSTGRRW